jgi:hypothetical protein
MMPTIEDAKPIATERRCNGVIIVFVQGGQIGCSSYGHTRSSCRAIDRLADAIFNGIQDGRIDVPDGLTTELPKAPEVTNERD